MRNVELKVARDAASLARARALALAAGAAPAGLLRQTDTYFHTPRGRLKLRQITEDGQSERAVLIGYARGDVAGARESEYRIVAIEDALGLIALLGATLGERAQVVKRRELLLLRHTRIHLDTVARLGEFVELETLVGAAEAGRDGAAGVADAAAGERELREIAAALELPLAAGIPGSYADLLERLDEEGTPR
ncbi:MAG TPA: class IV adenylate cyclase [Ktedonobacterales bacterium]